MQIETAEVGGGNLIHPLSASWRNMELHPPAEFRLRLETPAYMSHPARSSRVEWTCPGVHGAAFTHSVQGEVGPVVLEAPAGM